MAKRSKAEWDPRSEPSCEVIAKLEVIRTAAQMDLPTADIDRMLEEIETGFVPQKVS